MRNLTNDLVRHGSITTTEARAKAIRPMVERLITRAKGGTLAARRLLVRRAHNTVVVEKLLGDVAPRYADRNGGYLRIIKLGKSRKRDGSRLAKIEFV